MQNVISAKNQNSSSEVSRAASVKQQDNGETFYAALPVRVEEKDPKAWIRGVCYSPNGDFYVIDSSNSTAIKYSHNIYGKYKIVSKCKLPHRPRDITYVRTVLGGNTFDGLVITLEANKMAFVAPSMEIVRIAKTDGDYSGICCLTGTDLLVVVNAMMSSVDVITICGQPLYSYRMPNHLSKSHGYVTVAKLHNKPVITVSGQTGVICMKMEMVENVNRASPTLTLKSVQRYKPPVNDRFKSEGLCAIGDLVLVADFAGNRIIKFRLMVEGPGSDKVFLYKIGEHEVLEPLAVDIIAVKEGAAQVGLSRLKGHSPGYHLLKFINITTSDLKQDKILDPLYSPVHATRIIVN